MAWSETLLGKSPRENDEAKVAEAVKIPARAPGDATACLSTDFAKPTGLNLTMNRVYGLTAQFAWSRIHWLGADSATTFRGED